MNRTEFFLNPIGKYLRELSIIVVGIAITVISGLWINNRNNVKDIDLYLENIKIELQHNLDDIYLIKEYYDRAALYSEYLTTHKMQNLHPDTLKQYSDLTMDLIFFTYKTSAFKMFETSGTMRLMKDKDKVMSICNCYDGFEFLKTINDFYTQRKVTLIENLSIFSTGYVESELLLGFFANEMNKNWSKMFAVYTTHIEETIAILDRDK